VFMVVEQVGGLIKININMKLKRFNNFIINETIEDKWFKENPNFYLSKNDNIVKSKQKQNENDKDSSKVIYNKAKKLNVDDIEFEVRENNYFSLNSDFNPIFTINKTGDIRIFPDEKIKEQNYKFILALMKLLNKTATKNFLSKMFMGTEPSYTFRGVSNEIVNELFKNNNEYYGLYYTEKDDYSLSENLYLSKDYKKFINEVSEIKESELCKILYFNNKSKGKEVTDYESIEISKLKNILKNISYEDITFHTRDNFFYFVDFKDEALNDKVKKYHLIDNPFFEKEHIKNNKIYFGHLKNRIHSKSIKEEVLGIGLGYKIYKAFLKYQGYLISDEQSTSDARKMYFNLLKDPDVVGIIDKETNDRGQSFGPDSNKVMIIWKTNPKLEQIVKIVRTHELSHGKHYDYDKELLKYIK